MNNRPKKFLMKAWIFEKNDTQKSQTSTSRTTINKMLRKSGFAKEYRFQELSVRDLYCTREFDCRDLFKKEDLLQIAEYIKDDHGISLVRGDYLVVDDACDRSCAEVNYYWDGTEFLPPSINDNGDEFGLKSLPPSMYMLTDYPLEYFKNVSCMGDLTGFLDPAFIKKFSRNDLVEVNLENMVDADGDITTEIDSSLTTWVLPVTTEHGSYVLTLWHNDGDDDVWEDEETVPGFYYEASKSKVWKTLKENPIVIIHNGSTDMARRTWKNDKDGKTYTIVPFRAPSTYEKKNNNP